MKKTSILISLVFSFLLSFRAAGQEIIRISTDKTDLVLQVAPNGRLYQSHLGSRLLHDADLRNLSCYISAGSDGSASSRGWKSLPGTKPIAGWSKSRKLTNKHNLCSYLHTIFYEYASRD